MLIKGAHVVVADEAHVLKASISHGLLSWSHCVSSFGPNVKHMSLLLHALGDGADAESP